MRINGRQLLKCPDRAYFSVTMYPVIGRMGRRSPLRWDESAAPPPCQGDPTVTDRRPGAPTAPCPANRRPDSSSSTATLGAMSSAARCGRAHRRWSRPAVTVTIPCRPVCRAVAARRRSRHRGPSTRRRPAATTAPISRAPRWTVSCEHRRADRRRTAPPRRRGGGRAGAPRAARLPGLPRVPGDRPCPRVGRVPRECGRDAGGHLGRSR